MPIIISQNLLNLNKFSMMKAVVLGGAGVMGSHAADFLSKSGVFSDVIVADLNINRAKEIANKINADYAKVDAGNEESIKDVVRNTDVVINAIGPFYKFAYRVLKSVIEAGANYVDICDDYDVTLKIIDELNEKAKKQNVTAIVGLGASPGITNVAASYAVEQMDEVDEIKIYVTRSLKEEAGGAIPYHMLHAWLGEVPVYENGEFKKKRGLKDGKECIKFPHPFGEAFVYYLVIQKRLHYQDILKQRMYHAKVHFSRSISATFLFSLTQLD